MTDEHYKQWLNELKVGDEVVVEERYISSSLHISIVARITPKGGIRIKGHESMLFKNGKYHMEFGSYYLREPTDELLDKINLINMRRQLKATDWNKIDDDMVRDVWDLTGRRLN